MEKSKERYKTLRGAWKPSEYLAHAESMANNVRKLLRMQRDRDGFAGSPASTDDVESLAELVEDVSRFGRRQSASVAAEIAERVEPLLLKLAHNLDIAERPEGSV